MTLTLTDVCRKIRAQADALWAFAKELERTELWDTARSIKKVSSELHTIAMRLERDEGP
jgi:hypothetical protein